MAWEGVRWDGMRWVDVGMMLDWGGKGFWDKMSDWNGLVGWTISKYSMRVTISNTYHLHTYSLPLPALCTQTYFTLPPSAPSPHAND